MKRGSRDSETDDEDTGPVPPASASSVPPKSPKSPLLKHPRLHSPRVSSPLRMPPLRTATPESPTRSPASRTPSRTPLRRGAARDDENGDNDDTASRATASSSGVTKGILRRPDSAPEAADRRKSLGRRVSFARAARVKMFEKDPNAKAVPEPDPSRYYDDDEEDEDDDDNCPYDEPDFPATYRRSSGPHAFAPFVDEDIDPQPDSAPDHQADHTDTHPHHPRDSSMETSDAGDTSFEVPVKGNDSLDTTTTAPPHDDSDATASSLGSLGHLDSTGDAPRAANDEMDVWATPAPTTPGSAPPTWPSMIAASGRRNDAALTFPVSPIHAPDAPPAPANDDGEVSTANLTATLQASVVGQDEHAVAAQYEFDLDDGLTGVISHELSSGSESPAPRLYPTLDDMETGREDDALARYLAQVASSSAASERASPTTPRIARGIVDDDDDKTITLTRHIATPSPPAAFAAAAPTPTFTPPPAPATTAWTPGMSTPGGGGGETTSLLDFPPPPPPAVQHSPPPPPPPPPANEARTPSPEAESSLLDLFPPLESSSSETVPPQVQEQEAKTDLREASREMTEATQRNLQVLADSPVRQERYARPASAMRIGTPTMEPPAKRRRIASSPAISSPLARTPRRGTPTPRRMTPLRTPVQGVADVRVTPLSSRVNRLLNRKSMAMSPMQPPDGEDGEEEMGARDEDWIGDGEVGHLDDAPMLGSDAHHDEDDDELATPSRPRRRQRSRSAASPFPAVTDPDESVAFGDDGDDLMDVNLDLVEDLEHDDPRAPLHALNTLDDVLRDCGVDGFVETPVPDLPLTRRIATDIYPALVVHLPELDVHHTMCADLVDRIHEIDESNAAQLAEAEGTVPAFVRRYREAVEMGDDEERMELAEKARMTATGARRFALHAYNQAWAGQVQGLVATYQASREALVHDNAVLDEHVRTLSEAKSVLQDAIEEDIEARRKLRAEHETHMARLNGEVRAAREELESIRARRLDVERRCQHIREESRALETQVHTQQIRAQNLQRRIVEVDREAQQYTFFTIDDWKRVRDECDLITNLTGWTVDVVAPVADVREPVPVADLLERAAGNRGTRLVFTYRSTLRVEYDVKGGDWTLRSVAAVVGTDPSPARAYPGPAPRCSAHLVFTDHQLLTHAASLIMDRLARHTHLTCNVHTAMRWVATRWDAWLLLAHNVYALGIAMPCTVLIEQPVTGGDIAAAAARVPAVVSAKWHEQDPTSARVRVTVALAEQGKYKVDLHWVVDLWTVVAPVVGNVRVLRGTPFELEPVFGSVDPQAVWEAVNDPEIVPGDFISMARAAITAARRCNGVMQ
ncbi:hypothetical protein AMAG_18005 [Allomyces macrogynus ATCC 38327]|uniref:Knl1 C-terminal RWD domain-containing protein n=1 Tax=Allomyces macrogynus (strain ATCC 38327) TaxID=578462 RepID=A0A0L0S3J4_ALLM3|nr:hypothetical protein AMAG_18005 [Allomyces macrogynus ATCC 38327]|eukprot:KNE57128.1 hypothetical protein AMAG_18005 [Allomyces macrogynus ATCC 38327]